MKRIFKVMSILLGICALVILLRLLWSAYFLTTKEHIQVTLQDGKMHVSKTIFAPVHKTIYEVTNAGSQRHHFIIVKTIIAADKLPVENGQVRYYTYFDEPRITVLDGVGWSRSLRRGSEEIFPPDRTPGIFVEPGEKKTLIDAWLDNPKYRTGKLILFCNEPGHYERGEYVAARFGK
jgi:uncharacterized cupredoxin-like copper-binding protein